MERNEILVSNFSNARAKSGEVVNNFRTGYKVQALWSVDSQDIANNTSKVTIKVQFVSTGSSYTISASATKNGSLTVNGTTYSFTFNASLSGGQIKTVFTKTVNIPHNSDGTKTFSLSTTLGIDVTLSGKKWNSVTASGSGTLNTIPRTSSFTLSASSVAAGSAITVNISRASDSFTHKVFYSFGNKSATISTNATTSASYTIPLDHVTVIPNSTSGTGTISVDTYNGSTYIGSASKNFTVTVPASVKPSFSSLSAAVVDNGAPTSYGYVKGKSKCKLTINGAAGSQGSTIKSYSISGGGFSSSASSFTTGGLTSAGNITFTAYVTDSRGRKSDSKTVTINVLDYTNPTITEYNVIRCNSDASANDDGTYLKVWARYTYSSLNNKNAITSKVEYKATSTSTWTNAGSVGTGAYIVTGGGSIATDKSFDVRLTITDNFTNASKTMVIPTAFVTMDIKKGGKGIAFGKSAETNNLLDIGMNTKLGGTTTIAGDVKMISPNGSYNSNFIKRYEGDANGMGIAIQTGGRTVVGSGESAITFMDNIGSPGGETLHLTSDQNVELVSNMQNGYGDRKSLVFGNAGQLHFPQGGYITLPDNRGTWLNGATNASLRSPAQQTTGSYHSLLAQKTSSGHKISLGGLGDNFGFHVYDAARTENGLDKYFRINLANKQIDTDMRMVLYGDWYYTTGNTGWYNSTHGGGWFMQDSTWLRSYNNKNIYTANTLRCGTTETRYIKGNQGGSNSNLDILVYDGNSIYISPNAGSGASLYINRNWSGNNGTEPSFYNNKGNGWGFIGNSGQAFYRVYGAGGSVSDRNKKYEILKADTETQYENVRDLNIYNYRTISTLTTTVEELAEDFLRNNLLTDQGEYTTESKIIDGKEYIELDENLSQEEIKELRIKEIVEKNPHFGECKREDLSLGCMVDEMPLETTFYDNEGGDGKAVDMYSYTTMILGATKHLISKVETLEKENELKDNRINELESRLEKMEEILNGIINGK